MRFSSLFRFPLAIVLLVPACGVEFTTKVTSEEGAAGGAADENGATGGGSSDGDATGGTGAAHSMGGASPCTTDSECTAVVDLEDPCFQVGCQKPLAISLEKAENNACLLSWESYSNGQSSSSDCPGQSEDNAICPAICAVEPTCLTATCENGACRVNPIIDEKLCPENIEACQRSAEILDIKLNAARACSPDNSGVNPCESPGWVNDACFCATPTQSASGAAYEAAVSAAEDFAANCLPAEDCKPCKVVPDETSVTCRSNPFMPDVTICDTSSDK